MDLQISTPIDYQSVQLHLPSPCNRRLCQRPWDCQVQHLHLGKSGSAGVKEIARLNSTALHHRREWPPVLWHPADTMIPLGLLDNFHLRYCTYILLTILVNFGSLDQCFNDVLIYSTLQPFTEDFPHADTHEMLSPDLLHQLIKGTFKDHLVTWVGQYLVAEHGKREAKKLWMILTDGEPEIVTTK